MKNNKTFLKSIVLVAVISLFSSCVSTEKMVYFQNEKNTAIATVLANFEPQIQAGDFLSINVAAIDAAAAMPFNLYEAPTTTNLTPLLYLVAADGTINFPVLGTLAVGGLTTKQINEKLSGLLTAYIQQPIVNVRLTNFKVTVLGDVNKPGTYAVPNERITILEAIGLAGDLTIQGKRKNVQLVREKNGVREIISIDLTSKALFNSPYYYLAQNDVLYIEPNKTKINSSAVGSNTSILISSISALISLIAILTR